MKKLLIPFISLAAIPAAQAALVASDITAGGSAGTYTGTVAGGGSFSVTNAAENGRSRLIANHTGTTTANLIADFQTVYTGSPGETFTIAGGTTATITINPGATTSSIVLAIFDVDRDESYTFGTTALTELANYGTVVSGGESNAATFNAGTQTITGNGSTADENASLYTISSSSATTLTITNNAAAGDNDFAFVTLYTEATAVPEPSSTALLGLGGLALVLRRRR